jgi:hypothetical protein
MEIWSGHTGLNGIFIKLRQGDILRYPAKVRFDRTKWKICKICRPALKSQLRMEWYTVQCALPQPAKYPASAGFFVSCGGLPDWELVQPEPPKVAETIAASDKSCFRN